MVSVFLWVLYSLSAHSLIFDAEEGGPVVLVVDRNQYHIDESAVLFTYFFREKLLYIIFSDI